MFAQKAAHLVPGGDMVRPQEKQTDFFTTLYMSSRSPFVSVLTFTCDKWKHLEFMSRLQSVEMLYFLVLNCQKLLNSNTLSTWLPNCGGRTD